MLPHLVLSGAAALAGVIGWPIAHSRSPRLHNHWLARHHIDGAYLPFPVHPDDLATVIHGLRAAGLRGLNVTLPHKQAVMALCTHLDPSATRAGAVNTLVFSRSGIHGSNTDGTGFLANLQAHAATPGPTLILGAGGAARAIAAALLDAGAPVTLTNRTEARAQELAAALPGIRTVPWNDRAEALTGKSLLINTTQLGMNGQPPLDMPLDRAEPGLVVADIVYVPLQTPLLQAAGERGLQTVTGIGMLLHQAVPGFAKWFGVTPLVDQDLETAVLAP